MKNTDFETIPVSTKTFTTFSNIFIDINKLYSLIPITEYTIKQKKRGRKKKDHIEQQTKTVDYGSIITVKYQDKLRGVDLKQSKNKKWFRNSITIVIILSKPINIKICRNGTFQMTGCKFNTDSVDVVKYIWTIIKKTNTFTYKNTLDDQFYTYIIPSMRNIDFDIGFTIDRDKLNEYMYKHMDYHCILETSFGYTAVNIKMKLRNDIKTMQIKKLTVNETNTFMEETVTYNDYMCELSSKERENKLKSNRYITFLVFHSGKIIMSGLTREFMREEYKKFIDILRTAEEDIKEKLLI